MRTNVFLLATLTACSSSSAGSNPDSGTPFDAGADGHVSPAAVGTPCIPAPELSTTFLGFDDHEVTLDQGNAACGADVCLVNHFRGRASCPYGQNQSATGSASSTGGGTFKCGDPNPTPSSPCCTPGADQPVIATKDVGAATPTHSQVSASCSDRTADKTVYCSCRCANAAGRTDDGASYCACPSGFTCSQTVVELTPGDPLAGAYCVRDGTAFDVTTSCNVAPCDPMMPTCAASDAGTLPAADADTVTTNFVTSVHAFGSSSSCWFFALPTDASGKSICPIFFLLPSTDSCASHPGLSSADPTVQASVFQSQGIPASSYVLCLVAQLAPTPCSASTQAGWCYLSGANAPSGCQWAIEFSPAALPPANGGVTIGCP